MATFLVTFVIGIICIAIGVSNRKGNLSMLHSYHIKRVSEQDKIPFGRLVGLGMMIIGVSMMGFSALGALALFCNNELLVRIGTGIQIAGLVVGLGISFYAMFKYNKGLF